jgi:tetratricopeptide (TPR) repeat protein
MISLERGLTTDSKADVAAALELGECDTDALLALSVIADNLGETRESVRLLRELLAVEDCADSVRLKALNNLGSHLTATAPTEALDILKQAAALASQGFDHVSAVISHNIGSAYAYSGDLPAAMAAFHQAEQQLAKLGSPSVEHLLEVARIFGELQLVPEARSAAARAVGQLGGEGGAMVRADALLRLSMLARCDGDVPAAMRALEEATTLFGSQSRPYGLAAVVVERGSIALDHGGLTNELAEEVESAATQLASLGKVPESASARLLAAELYSRCGAPERAAAQWRDAIFNEPGVDQASAMVAKCRLAQHLGDPVEAMRAALDAMDHIDATVTLAQDCDLRFRMGVRRPQFELIHRDALRGSDPSKILDLLLQSRPPAPLLAAKVDLTLEADVESWRECERLLGSEEFLQSCSPEQLVALRRRSNALEQHLRTQRWSLSAARTAGRFDPESHSQQHGAPGGLESVSEDLNLRDLLAVVRMGDEAVGLTLSDGRPHLTRLCPWELLLTDVSRLGRLLARLAMASSRHGEPATGGAVTRRDSLIEQIRHCSATLGDVLRPALERVGDTVVLLTDRRLDGVPWCVIEDLGQRCVQVAAYEAPRSLWTRADAGPHSTPSEATVMLGAGPGLVHAAEELARLAEVWVDRTVRVEGRLRSSTLLDSFNSHVVHLAAHGELRQDSPLFATLSLCDGPVTIAELLQQPRMPNVVCLSACSLGGRPQRSVVAGVVPMMLQYGISEAVAATVALSDAYAPSLAEVVHRSLADGQSAARGLQRARLERTTSPQEHLARCTMSSFVALR